MIRVRMVIGSGFGFSVVCPGLGITARTRSPYFSTGPQGRIEGPMFS
jgi:hypothetical protein